MSDDEDVIYKKPQKTIHYGTLESNEWVNKQTLEEIQSDEDEYEPESKRPANATTSTVTAPSTGSGNVHISNEYFKLEEEMYVQHYILSSQLLKFY